MAQHSIRLTHVLIPDDVDFFTELARALKTQDRAGTAPPVIFRVMETKRRIAMDPACSEGMVLVLGEDGTEFFETDVAEAKAFLREYAFDNNDRDALDAVDTLSGLAAFCEEKEIPDFHYTGYEHYEQCTGVFLTRAACEHHIAAYRNHYDNPKVYADHAWRNPEFERLLAIVEEFAR